jgi:hypothetical protein
LLPSACTAEAGLRALISLNYLYRRSAFERFSNSFAQFTLIPLRIIRRRLSSQIQRKPNAIDASSTPPDGL